jgi:hypothetical protein
VTGADRVWIQTATGKQFFPLAPRVEDIEVFDIASGLANQCRFSGQTREFYSIAEHSVRVSMLMQSHGIGPAAALVGLLHDAAEAYLVDMPQPVKYAVQGYREAEERVQAAIFERFGIVEAYETNRHLVKSCDRIMLATEKRDLMPEPPAPWIDLPEPHPVPVEAWEPKLARRRFLERFYAVIP